MDRFVVKKKETTAGTAPATTDLFSLLQQKRQQQLQPLAAVLPAVKEETAGTGTANKKQKKTHTAAAEPLPPPAHNPNEAYLSWAERESDRVSFLDLACEQRLAQMKARSYTDWKVDQDGNRVYTTFRNGGRVTAGGKEGFLLAMGDGVITKKDKDGTHNGDNDKINNNSNNKERGRDGEGQRKKRVIDAVVEYVESEPTKSTTTTTTNNKNGNEVTDFFAAQRKNK